MAHSSTCNICSSPRTLFTSSFLSLLQHKNLPSLLDHSHQYTNAISFLILKIKTLLDSIYLTSYCLISLFFIAKYVEWYTLILAISDSALLFLLEYPPIRNLSYCIKIDRGKFTSGFYVVKSNQFLVFILLELSVSFGIILLLQNLTNINFFKKRRAKGFIH